HPSGAPAEGLERECPRAGAAVDDQEPVHALPEPVEQRLLDAIGQRPGLEASWGEQPAALERPAYDPETAHGRPARRWVVGSGRPRSHAVRPDAESRRSRS